MQSHFVSDFYRQSDRMASEVSYILDTTVRLFSGNHKVFITLSLFYCKKDGQKFLLALDHLPLLSSSLFIHSLQ